MPHPLVTQLRFTRSEFRRAIDGVTAEEAARRFGPINPIAWITGHLSWHGKSCDSSARRGRSWRRR
jgi:hypothetical protein